jgi:NADH:ubiquinone oxidoreductase subunit 4 (subunit M)
MTALALDDLIGVVAFLLATAAWLAAYRPRPRDAGVAAGILLFTCAVFLGMNPPVASGLHLDAVSFPRIATLGAMTIVLFATLPRRITSWSLTVAIMALVAANLMVVVAPGRALTAVGWVASCLLTSAVLPSGQARRLAFPYLVLAAGAGVAGLALDGIAGMSLLLLAVAVRLGVFPFHSWVVGAYQLAPTSVAVMVAAPMSAIALVARSPLGLDGTLGTSLTIALVVSAMIAGGLTLVQRELARAVGFLTVSVQTIVLVGLMDSDDIGHVGGLMMWNLTGLALMGLGLVVAALRSRVGPVSLVNHSGLMGQTPVFAALFLLFGLAAVGAPGTADFASEDLVLHGGMAHHPALLFLFISAVSIQGYAVMYLFFRVFYGPPSGLTMADAALRERIALIALGACLVLTGLAPQLIVDGWMANATPTVAPEASQHASAHP